VPVPGSELVGAFPCHPSRQERRVELVGRPVLLSLLSCDQGGVTYGLATADVEDPARVDAVLTAMAEAARHGIGAREPAPVPLSFAGVTPYRGNATLRLSGQRTDGRPVEEAIDLFARGTRVFQATAIGTTLPDPAVQPFHAGLHFRGVAPG
jgi:hypothetical protein